MPWLSLIAYQCLHLHDLVRECLCNLNLIWLAHQVFPGSNPFGVVPLERLHPLFSDDTRRKRINFVTH
jgi:hypothetical protein